jgi:hypothetical protein
METSLLPTPQKVISFHFKLDTDGELPGASPAPGSRGSYLYQVFVEMV